MTESTPRMSVMNMDTVYVACSSPNVRSRVTTSNGGDSLGTKSKARPTLTMGGVSTAITNNEIPSMATTHHFARFAARIFVTNQSVKSPTINCARFQYWKYSRFNSDDR